MSWVNVIVSAVCGLLGGGLSARIMVTRLVTDDHSSRTRSSVRQRATRNSQNVAGDQTNIGDSRGW
jgi:hypothetical protein